MSRKGRIKGLTNLNLWVGENEKAWIKASAARESMTVTTWLRCLIRRGMDQERLETQVSELNRRAREETER